MEQQNPVDQETVMEGQTVMEGRTVPALSRIGRDVLVAREGRRLTAYRDSVGVWTIGVGHTSAAGPPVVRPGLSLTAAECDALFARDVERYVRTVREALPAGSDLPQHAFDALVSLCFNIGQGGFLRSSVLRRLRAGDRAGAAAAILVWNRPPEVIPRRQGEHDQFRTPSETALPRARRGDPRPIPSPAPGPTATAGPSPRAPAAGPATAGPVPRRRRPQPPRPVPSVGPASPPASRGGLLARLFARLLKRRA